MGSATSRRIAGWSIHPTPAPGVYTYDFETNSFERVTDFGSYPRWLSDGRRLLVMSKPRLSLVDGETGKSRELLDVSPHRLWSYSVSEDDRIVYYDLTTVEADVWPLTRE